VARRARIGLHLPGVRTGLKKAESYRARRAKGVEHFKRAFEMRRDRARGQIPGIVRALGEGVVIGLARIEIGVDAHVFGGLCKSADAGDVDGRNGGERSWARHHAAVAAHWPAFKV